MSLEKVVANDLLVWDRAPMYGGPVFFTAWNVTPKRIVAKVQWEFQKPLGEVTFRKSDGRVVGNRHNMYFVRPAISKDLRPHPFAAL